MLRLMLLAVLALTVTAWGQDGDSERLSERLSKRLSVDKPDRGASEMTFSDLVEGQSIVLTPTGGAMPLVGEGILFCVRFIGPWRFESYDPNIPGFGPWFAGDYADVSSDGMGSTLSFTWDPNNDPDEYELVVDLMFTSEMGGAYESVYSEGDDILATEQGDFEIVERRIDDTECRIYVIPLSDETPSDETPNAVLGTVTKSVIDDSYFDDFDRKR